MGKKRKWKKGWGFFMVEISVFNNQIRLRWVLSERISSYVRDYRTTGMKACDNFFRVPAFTIILTEVITIQWFRDNKKWCLFSRAIYLTLCQQMHLQFPRGKAKSTGSKGLKKARTEPGYTANHYYLSGLIHINENGCSKNSSNHNPEFL